MDCEIETVEGERTGVEQHEHAESNDNRPHRPLVPDGDSIAPLALRIDSKHFELSAQSHHVTYELVITSAGDNVLIHDDKSLITERNSNRR